MITVTKEWTFALAHMLAGHQGLCQNVHGHEYKLQVEATKIMNDLIASGPSQGMVMDFKDLKTGVKELIVDKYDHGFATNVNSDDVCELKIAKILKQHGKKVIDLDYRPTAENMVKHWYKELNEYYNPSGIKITCVRLWETATSFAEAK